MNGKKEYVIIVDGPDDVIPVCGELEALREANEINKLYREDLLEYGEAAILCLATVETKDENDSVESVKAVPVDGRK